MQEIEAVDSIEVMEATSITPDGVQMVVDTQICTAVTRSAEEEPIDVKDVEIEVEAVVTTDVPLSTAPSVSEATPSEPSTTLIVSEATPTEPSTAPVISDATPNEPTTELVISEATPSEPAAALEITEATPTEPSTAANESEATPSDQVILASFLAL